MFTFVIRTVPKGVKLTGPITASDLTASDLTEEVLVTNSEGIAKSSVDGSRKPMAAFAVSDTYCGDSLRFNNLDRVNGVIERKTRSYGQIRAELYGRLADALATGDRAAILKMATGQRPQKTRKPGPSKGRFDHVKPVRKDEAPAKREVIVERV